MDNPEKLATYGRQDKDKRNILSVGHYYTQTNTDNVNKTWALLQTTGGKDEPNNAASHELFPFYTINLTTIRGVGV